MAMKDHWIAKATSKGKGIFSAKAKKAGKTTREFASEKADAAGKVGKQARLAETLMKMH